MDPMSYLLEVKHYLLDKGGAYEEFLQTIKDFKAQKFDTTSLIKRLTKLFHGHENLIVRFKEFLPKEYKIVSKEDEAAHDFIKRVETTFKNDHGAFLEFLQILDTYRGGNKSIIEVYKEIAVLLRGQNNLFLEFKSFLPDTSVRSSISSPADILHAKKKRKIEENYTEKRVCGKALAFYDKVKGTLGDFDICQEIMKCVELYSNKIITRLELRELVDGFIGEHPELVKGFDEFMETSEKARKSEKVCLSKSMEDNIEELKLLKCDQITPSYRLLPMNCRNPAVRHESLNDGCVCVCPVKVDFRIRGKNQFEKKLDINEDHIFELNMKMHLTNATVHSTEELLRKMKNNHKNEKYSGLCLEEHFTEQKLKCIKELFHDRGPKFLDSLRAHIHIVLPIVLKRLIQKQKELNQKYEDSKIGWHKIFADNHRGALGFPRRFLH